ncbi:TIGR04283 family arsenosugar biosynthesis glycosyltransferase [Calidifontimicrobium sp. SYSU G02091]|uniref:TIGR04283 family arsenosugar biosynthesis glycosyltransferase n=1 Tax=Calidifontimicrobium sp. SYSU G02091 TaxID=2926421 RepID=UPI001F538E6E|nr:TIGR04283 family arsenosugar biosynthesis glycosyltransferase [Calidifontimicrobium sp. SYSU G02091]
MTRRVSIVVPALNEAAGIAATLGVLAPWRAAGHEVIVVDGGSTDATARLATAWADRVLAAPRGRARQMNAGAAAARHGVLLFLHADTRLPPGALAAVERALQRGAAWGRFDVRIDGRSRGLAVVAALMNLRSRATGIATGDQAIFVRRDAFDAVGGFPDQPLMEDVELSRRLKRSAGRPACLRERVVTSGRRWDEHGVWRTVWLMWTLRWRYWRGTPAEVLAQAYH